MINSLTRALIMTSLGCSKCIRILQVDYLRKKSLKNIHNMSDF
jgi:hypothetical protein